MAWYLKRACVFAGLVAASIVAPDQHALIQSNSRLHQDLLPATALDQTWMRDFVARMTLSIIVMLVSLALARRFDGVPHEGKAVKLDTPSREALRPLWWAAEVGDVELLAAALDAEPAGARLVDEDGRTALHIAALHGASDSLKYLLQREVDVNMRDAHGETALHLAADAGHLCSLLLLLDAGASQEQQNAAGRTALGKARAAGENAACELLMEHSGVQLAFEQ